MRVFLDIFESSTMYPSRKMVKSRLKVWITSHDVEKWINNKEVFFILAIGRSGTMFLSQLLNKSPNALVVHEPVRSDFRAYKQAFYSEIRAHKYIRKFRKKEIFLRNRKNTIEIYGEVNSVLRRHCNAIKKSFPKAKILHLIRDGRDVVRSMLSRKTMTNEDQNTKNIMPENGDLWYNEWSSMNRFERLCWYWDVENRYLSENIENTIIFEELISNYEYFKTNLLIPLDLEISEEIWQREVKTPKNITPKYNLHPHWTKWDQKNKENFFRLCGDTMNKLGYSLNSK